MRKYIYIISLLAILSSLIRPNYVYAAMATETVAGEGLPTSGTYFGAPATFVNMQSDDGDLTYLSLGAAQRHSYDFTNFTSAGVIGNVIHYYKVRNPGSAVIAQAFCRNKTTGNNYYESSAGQPVNLGVYQLLSYTWATDPATGLAWTPATLNDYTFGIKCNTSAYTMYWTYTYLEVYYTPPVPPSVDTDPATNNIYDAAALSYNVTLNGDITSTGGDVINCRGFEWGTTSNLTTPLSTESPRTLPYTANYTECTGGDWGIGPFSYMVTGLAGCTTYYYRTYAHNSAGWGWGAERSFTTLCPPDITTQPATYVEATTARLNSLVITDGGQLADVRFCYGTVSGSCADSANCTSVTCNCTTYNTTTPWVNNTYATGSTPYLDLSGLTPGTTYYYCAQIRNDVGCYCGGQQSFLAIGAIGTPTILKGIPTGTTISLFWIKGLGATNTLIRYKIGSYPGSTADGTLAYFDTMTSVLIEHLTPGTTYHFRMWGESGGTYSSSNATLMLTTLAATAAPGTLPSPTAGTNWFQAPDYANVSGLFFYGMVNWWADTFGIPRGTLWFLCAVAFCTAGGIFIYSVSHKILVGDFAVVILIGLFAAMKLMPMWFIVPFIIIAFATVALGERI